MKNLFVVMMLSLLSLNAFAAYETCEIGNSGLPAAVVQKLKSDCEALRLEQIQKEAADKAAGKAAKIIEASTPLITPEKLSSWTTVAEGFSKAIGAAATQVGVSVNEFIKTPAGMITVAVIVWKAFGGDITKLMTLVFLTLSVYYINRHVWTDRVEYLSKKFYGYEWHVKRRTLHTWATMPDSGGWLSVLGTLVYVVAFTCILLSIG